MRTLVLVAGVLLVLALVAFLAIGKWKNPFNVRDIPKRLGIEIQSDSSGVTFSHAMGAHSQFKIHASKVVQYKQGTAQLHDVKIELYGEDGSRVDRIEGAEFEYDQKNGTARATGPVEITLMRPGEAPAIAPKASAEQAVGAKANPIAAAAQAASAGEIHVKTSGLTFDQKSGIATTQEHVEFALAQGDGSAMGATYDSQKGTLMLASAVVLNARRGGEPVALHAQHAEFERGSQVCTLSTATAGFKGGEATAGEAKIAFRTDGSASRLDAMGGFTLATANGSHVAASTGSLEFNERNQPRRAHLAGGVTMDSDSQTAGNERKLHGSAPTAELEFSPQGRLRQAHLERGVDFDSQQQSEPAAGAKAGQRVSRHWSSPVADVEFRESGAGQTEPAKIRGTQGVVVTGESRRSDGTVTPSRLQADEVTGDFGSGSQLLAVTGTGHAGIEETAPSGSRQTSSGDRLEAHFAAHAGATVKHAAGGEPQVQSATVEGHVVLVQEPAAKAGAAVAPLRATAGRAEYEGAGEWLHLTLSPRVEDGGLQLTADKIDVSQASGDAFAHGNVKASWVDTGTGKSSQRASQANDGIVTLGGQGPAHIVAAEAQLHQATGEATFRGQARLWQQANSIAAPTIVLDRARQTLVARAIDAVDPVRAVLVAAGGAPGKEAAGKQVAPSVIRVRGGELKYSDAERKAVMRGGALGSVVAEMGAATTSSNEVELQLQPAGNHAGKDGAAAQVDRIVATGRVVVASQGRRGTGEQLVFTSETGEYVLTGSAGAPPRMTDTARGTVTGEALIFRGRDDSVSIEGGGRKTTTETTAPK